MGWTPASAHDFKLILLVRLGASCQGSEILPGRMTFSILNECPMFLEHTAGRKPFAECFPWTRQHATCCAKS
jgi:hypothetical protein